MVALFTVDLSLAQPRAAASLGSLFAAPACSTLKALPKLCLLSGMGCISLLAALLAALSLGDFADPAPQWRTVSSQLHSLHTSVWFLR